MKYHAIILLYVLQVVPAFAQSDTLSLRSLADDSRSVFFINCHGAEGTAFLVLRDNRQYFVTAHHVAALLRSPFDTISVSVAGKWMPWAVQLVAFGKPGVDLCVFCLNQTFPQLPLAHTPLAAVGDDFEVGSEVWILGFPLELQEYNPGRPYPYPLPKHGYLVGVAGEGEYYLDAMLNPGTSGGPVFCRTTRGELRIMAVVDSTRTITMEGVMDSLQHTKFEYSGNAGFALSVSAAYIDGLIDSNPIGPAVSKQ